MEELFQQLFSHIPPQFQFNGIFQQSEGVQKYFFSIAINSSLSFINEQIFRLLLKISVYERQQLRIWTIYQASFEEAITSLGHADSTLGSYEVRVAHKHHQTFPNQFSHQISVIDSSRAQKQKWETLQKKFWSQQHPVFPGGHPSKYWLGSMLLNFSDRTRTGVFNMIWPLARVQENVNILFQQRTYIKPAA